MQKECAKFGEDLYISFWDNMSTDFKNDYSR